MEGREAAAAPLVLLVEDSPELRHVLRVALEGEGFEVHSSGNQGEAMKMLRDRPYDLVVVDPPASSDPDALAAAVQGEYPRLPIIVIAELADGLALFFGAWKTTGTRLTLRKPFKLSDLIGATREVMRRTARAS